MTRQGQIIFADELARFAAETADEQIMTLAQRVAAPISVAVTGRPGVGTATVADALRSVGVAVCDGSATADVVVVVIAEVIKPEDLAAVAAAPGPAVVVLNKADLCGFGRGGPMAVAEARAERFRRLAGVRTVPMIAHLAVATVDAESLAALAIMSQEPADLSSVDRFVDSDHLLPRAVRDQLLQTLDVFGIAHAVVTSRTHGESVAARLPALLRRLSRVDVVAEHVTAAAAEVLYRRGREAMAELERLAVGDDRVARFLSSDDVVIARMAAAVDVVQAAGLTVDTDDDAGSHVRRAVRWRNYSRGPVSMTHHDCGTDIARGSLRLLARKRGENT